MQHKNIFLSLLIGTLATGLCINQAYAVPSYARQTGMACSACHTVFPELNAFGRSFKLNGYTMTGIKQVESKNETGASDLQFNQIPPLSAMLQTSITHNKSETPSTQYTLPDELSIFYSGDISPHIGSFIQMTMEQGSGFSLDNTDIRYANQAGKVTYGVTVNNSPTVQDLWNSTPAWGFPWTHGADVTGPIIADALAQNVAGLGAYSQWGNGIYSELSLYRETNTFDSPGGATDTRIHNFAPYLRLAWDRAFNGGDYLMLGAYGMQTALVDGASYAGPEDKYSDAAIDTQYEHPMANNNMISVHASYTNENQTLDLSGGGAPTLNNLRVDGAYYWGHHAAATLGYTDSSGNSGAYDDTAFVGQFSYLPWQNTKFTAQYVVYTKKGGSTSNVSDNNTALVQAWLMW
jgi:hypothetical protein